ncbi:MAG: hypothetical protein Q9222_000920 [Ikaeria aurantiellina]
MHLPCSLFLFTLLLSFASAATPVPASQVATSRAGTAAGAASKPAPEVVDTPETPQSDVPDAPESNAPTSPQSNKPTTTEEEGQTASGTSDENDNLPNTGDEVSSDGGFDVLDTKGDPSSQGIRETTKSMSSTKAAPSMSSSTMMTSTVAASSTTSAALSTSSAMSTPISAPTVPGSSDSTALGISELKLLGWSALVGVGVFTL